MTELTVRQEFAGAYELVNPNTWTADSGGPGETSYWVVGNERLPRRQLLEDYIVASVVFSGGKLVGAERNGDVGRQSTVEFARDLDGASPDTCTWTYEFLPSTQGEHQITRLVCGGETVRWSIRTSDDAFYCWLGAGPSLS